MSAAWSGPSVRRSSPFASTWQRSADRDRALRALLDEQDAEAALADRREHVEDDVDDGRREPERRLVEQQDVGLGDERAGDRELLLLAARERAGVPAAELLDDREELEDAAQRRCASPPRAARREAEAQVLLDRQLAEDAPALRHERDAVARDVLRPAAAQRGVRRAGCRRRSPARRP